MTDDNFMSPDTLAVLDTLAAEAEAPSTAATEEAAPAPETAAEETTEGSTETEAKDADAEAQEGEAEADKAEDEEEAADEPEKPKKRSGTERLKRRIAALEAELAERRPAAAPAGQEGDAIARVVEAEIGPAPKEEDYKGDYLAYERALTAYETEKRIVARDVKRQLATQQARAAEAMADKVADHSDRIDALLKEVPSAKAKLAAAAKAEVSEAVSQLVLDSDKSAHLALHFAENPDTLARLNRMSPVQAAREIGRLEARLSSPKPKTATKAPPPVAPVKGSAKPARTPEQLPMNEFASWLSKELYR